MSKDPKKKKPAFVAVGIERNRKNSKYVHATRHKDREFHEVDLAEDASDEQVFAAIRKAVAAHGDDCVIGFGKTTHKASDLIARVNVHDASIKKRKDVKRKRQAAVDAAADDAGVSTDS
jgi:hypothetical protein